MFNRGFSLKKTNDSMKEKFSEFNTCFWIENNNDFFLIVTQIEVKRVRIRCCTRCTDGLSHKIAPTLLLTKGNLGPILKLFITNVVFLANLINST